MKFVRIFHRIAYIKSSMFHMALQISHTFSQGRINAGDLMAKKHFVSQDISQGDVCCVTTKICFTGCFTWLSRGSKSNLKFHS